MKNASIDVEKALTKEIQIVLKQQLKFEKETWTVINEVQDWKGRMIAAELMNAQEYPVYEQRYKADPDNPLSLFDCMKP